MIHHVRPVPDNHGAGGALTPQSLPPIIADLADSVVIPLTSTRGRRPFNIICGRAIKLQRSGNEELALCVPKAQNYDVDTKTYSPWAYVPLSFDTDKRGNKETNGVAPNDWFDMAVNCIPTDVCHVSSFANDEIIDESKLGDPMTRIRVSTVDSDYQVIAISINHALVDAGSISLFMQAWSRQYQLCREQQHGGAEADKQEEMERPNITFHHPIFDIDGKQDDENAMVPSEWTRLLPNESGGENPFVENKASMTNETKNISCTVYYRSRDQIEVLKNKSLEEANRETQQQFQGQTGIRTPPYVSSNDALLGEVCKQLEATSVLLCIDWRPVLNRLAFFGYAVLFLYLDLPSSSNAPAACRNILGWKDCNGEEGSPSIVGDDKFVLWKMQNETKQGRTDLIWNSWTDFFTLYDKEYNGCRKGENFAEMECCPHDMLMSEEMCRARIDVAKRGLSYAIIFPQPHRGARVYFFGPSEVGLSLQPKFYRI